MCPWLGVHRSRDEHDRREARVPIGLATQLAHGDSQPRRVDSRRVLATPPEAEGGRDRRRAAQRVRVVPEQRGVYRVWVHRDVHRVSEHHGEYHVSVDHGELRVLNPRNALECHDVWERHDAWELRNASIPHGGVLHAARETPTCPVSMAAEMPRDAQSDIGRRRHDHDDAEEAAAHDSLFARATMVAAGCSGGHRWRRRGRAASGRRRPRRASGRRTSWAAESVRRAEHGDRRTAYRDQWGKRK